MPVSLHILTGHGWHLGEAHAKTVERYRGSVIFKYQEIAGAFFELIFYGALKCHPRLKFVTVENEAGWISFTPQQWDHHYQGHRTKTPAAIKDKDASEIFLSADIRNLL